MPFYRVPFFGSLLVEADTFSAADGVAHRWTGSMRQATHSVEIQPVSAKIKAAEFCIEANKINDITEELQDSIKRDEEEARNNPGGQLIGKMFCMHSYYVGLQIVWESFEFERMRPPGNNLNQT